MLRLNAQDEYFLDSETATAPTHIGGLEIYRLPKGAGRDFMQKLYTRLTTSPVRAEPFNYQLATVEPEEEKANDKAPSRLRRPAKRKKKPQRGRGWAILKNVNPEDHVYLHALPKPGGQRELGELVARLHVNRLDRLRPLWEVHLIEGLEGGRYAVYTKLHHSQFDGRRGMVLSKYVRSTKASTRGLPPMWAVELDKAGRSDKSAGAPAPSALQSLTSWGKALSSMAGARRNKPGEGVIAPYTAPATILNGPLTARRRLGTQSLPISRIKSLGAAVEGGATVNEVLLAVCGGALRRYLLDHGALPKEPLIAACPVAQARKDDAASGNAVGQILVSLATNVADPKERLETVVASSRVNKGLMKELPADAYAHYTELSMIPQVLAAKTAIGHKVLNANLVISNVPGPREAQYTNGALLESMYSASMLLAGQALNITACNFGENLDIGIMACPDLCPSPQKIAVCAGEELAILEKAMGVRKSSARKAHKPAPARPAKKAVAKKVTAKKATAAKGAQGKTVEKQARAKRRRQ
jgi:WS/DGAT/MGAT family acyltransferase